MRPLSARELILIGFLLVFFGFLMPLLMTIRVIEASFLLSFVSYGASIVGLVMGTYGAAIIVRSRRDD
jgi:hypothetical protein